MLHCSREGAITAERAGARQGFNWVHGRRRGASTENLPNVLQLSQYKAEPGFDKSLGEKKNLSGCMLSTNLSWRSYPPKNITMRNRVFGFHALQCNQISLSKSFLQYVPYLLASFCNGTTYPRLSEIIHQLLSQETNKKVDDCRVSLKPHSYHDQWILKFMEESNRQL